MPGVCRAMCVWWGFWSLDFFEIRSCVGAVCGVEDLIAKCVQIVEIRKNVEEIEGAEADGREDKFGGNF